MNEKDLLAELRLDLRGGEVVEEGLLRQNVRPEVLGVDTVRTEHLHHQTLLLLAGLKQRDGEMKALILKVVRLRMLQPN